MCNKYSVACDSGKGKGGSHCLTYFPVVIEFLPNQCQNVLKCLYVKCSSLYKHSCQILPKGFAHKVACHLATVISAHSVTYHEERMLLIVIRGVESIFLILSIPLLPIPLRLFYFYLHIIDLLLIFRELFY